MNARSKIKLSHWRPAPILATLLIGLGLLGLWLSSRSDQPKTQASPSSTLSVSHNTGNQQSQNQAGAALQQAATTNQLSNDQSRRPLQPGAALDSLTQGSAVDKLIR